MLSDANTASVVLVFLVDSSRELLFVTSNNSRSIGAVVCVCEAAGAVRSIVRHCSRILPRLFCCCTAGLISFSSGLGKSFRG